MSDQVDTPAPAVGPNEPTEGSDDNGSSSEQR